MTSAKQLQIDYGRSARREILREAALPATRSRDGKLVKSQLLWSVLIVLEDYGGARDCFPSLETIAARCRQSERSVARALEVLQSLSLITWQRKRPWNALPGQSQTYNHYTVVWSELLCLCPFEVRARILSAEGLRVPATVTSADQCRDTGREQVAPAREQVAPAREQVAPAREQVAPAPLSNPVLIPRGISSSNPATVTSADQCRDTGLDWTTIAAELQRVGVGLHAHTAQLASQLEFTPAEVWRAIETQQAQPTRLQPGAIRWWIMHDRTWPTTGVQDPEVLRATQVKAAAQRASAAADATASAAADDTRRQQLAELERAYGATLDGMDADQLRELARETFRSDFEFARFVRAPRSEYVRKKLLESLHQPEASARESGRQPVTADRVPIRSSPVESVP